MSSTRPQPTAQATGTARRWGSDLLQAAGAEPRRARCCEQMLRAPGSVTAEGRETQACWVFQQLREQNLAGFVGFSGGELFAVFLCTRWEHTSVRQTTDGTGAAGY